MKRKIMAVMVRREAYRRLDGRVEMDDAYRGGVGSGGKRSGGPDPCRRAPAQARVRAAPNAGRPWQRRPSPTPCTSGTPLTASPQAIGPTRTGSGRRALGNIKNAITGTYRSLRPDQAERCLATFAWRRNRRHRLNSMIPRFIRRARHTTKPISTTHRRMTSRDKSWTGTSMKTDNTIMRMTVEKSPC